ncbi:Uncharacterised protein [[Pasteurella] mairii]|uniref:Uncharacterized protein n=1 Tax=[Pasteurella] mairii TaxID=757 RepID=A0A379B0B5_9PAST|nr:Uncharacterised protein [[Pasteurella] mairii]
MSIKKEALLNWAKAHYRDYKDVIVGANTLDMPPGVVYSLLKQHDFIKKTDTTEYRVMMAYFKYNGRLCDIVKETGLTVWIVAKTIEALGYSPRWQEYRNSRYVSKVGVAGVGAEEKFKQLVPDAVDMNEEYRENNRDFDFIVHEKNG